MAEITSIFNPTPDRIGYINSADQVTTVTFQDAAEANTDKKSKTVMLVESVQLSLQRGTQKKHFLNADSAMLVGKAQGTLTLTGLFASAEAMSKILNGNGKNACTMKQTIVVNAGSLVTCTTSANGKETKSENLATGAKLTCKDCVATSFSLTNQLQQDGQLFQQATVTFTVTDVMMNNVEQGK